MREAYDIAVKDPNMGHELKAQIAIYQQTLSALKEPASPSIESDPGKKEREENGNPFDEAEQRAKAKIEAQRKGQSVKADKDIIKAQKEYLNEKLAKALKEAPDDPYTSLSTKELQDLDAYRKEYERVAPKYANTIKGHTAEQLDKLHGDYYTARHAYIEYYNELLATNKLPYIELNVPYDGVFRIVNSKNTIKQFMERIGKNASKIRLAQKPLDPVLKVPPRKYRDEVKYGKNDLGKIAQMYVSKTDDRQMLKKAVEYSNAVIATDGRRIFIGKASAGGAKGGVIKLSAGDRKFPDGQVYPNAMAVLPKEILSSTDFFPLDKEFVKVKPEYQVGTAQLLEWATAVNISKPGYGESIALHRGTDGKLAIRGAHENVQYASHNHDPHAFDEMVFQPAYLQDIAKTAQELGTNIVEFRAESPHSPIVVLFRRGGGDTAVENYVIQMPVRKEYEGKHISGYNVEEAWREKGIEETARTYIRHYRTQRNLDRLNNKPNPYLKELDEFFANQADNAVLSEMYEQNPILTKKEMVDIQKAFILGQYYSEGELRLKDYWSLRKAWTKLHDKMADFYIRTLRDNAEAEFMGSMEAIRLQEVADVNEHILAGGFIDAINKTPDPTSLIGKQMPNPENLTGFIVEAQVLRNPQFEYQTMIGVRNGKIVDALTYTAKKPTQAPLAPANTAMAQEAWVKEQSAKYDRVYFVHNHPTGNVEPSPGDLKASNLVDKLIPNYGGMVVINHGEYTFVDKYGDAHYGSISKIQRQYDLLNTPAIADPILNVPFEPQLAPKIIDDYIKHMDGTDPKSDATEYLGFYLDANYKVRGVARLPVASANFMELLGSIRQMGRELGAKNVVLYEPPARNISEANKQRELGDYINMALANDVLVQFVRAGSEYIQSSADWNPDGNIFPSRNDIEIVQEEGDFEYGKGETTPLEEMDARSSEPVKSAFQYIDSNGKVVEQEFVLDAIPPIQIPEILQLIKAIKGEYPKVKDLGRKTRGYLQTEGTDWEIVINSQIFKLRNDQAAKTIMHEIGHLIDFLDDYNLKRGNILGRIKSGFENKAKTLPAFMGMPVTDFTMTQKERNKIRYDARKQIIAEIEREALLYAKENEIELDANNILQSYAEALAIADAGGVKLNANLGGAMPKLEARIKESTRKRYLQMLTDRFAEGGMIENSALHAELIDLMDWWKPIPKNASKKALEHIGKVL